MVCIARYRLSHLVFDSWRFIKEAFRELGNKRDSRRSCGLTWALPAILLPLPRIGGEGRGEGVHGPVERSPPHPNPLPRCGGEGTNCVHGAHLAEGEITAPRIPAGCSYRDRRCS